MPGHLSLAAGPADDGDVPTSPGAHPLDALAREVLARSPYRFTVATSDAERAAAFALRRRATVSRGWQPVESVDVDQYDATAVHVVGWAGDTAIATGRLVLPPGPLPTEDAWGIRVPPPGRVVDVGRMTVASDGQNHAHTGFLALLAALYLETRERGYTVACGAMSAQARALLRLLGLDVEVVGPERWHLGEARAPVRFTASASGRRAVADRPG
jgi:hypothetical protein